MAVAGASALVRIASVLAFALAVPAGAPSAQGPPAPPGAPGAVTRHAPPELAPDFVRKDLTGRPVRLSALRGKLVLLSFWATWCEPCRAEAPRFSTWQQQYGPRGLQIIGIAMDDDAAPVHEFVRRLQLAYPVVLGDAPLAELFGGVFGLPLAFLIDPSGRMVARYRGELDLPAVESRIRASLPSAPP